VILYVSMHMLQTLELEESQRDAEELGGVMGPGRGKVIASKGTAQKFLH